MARLVAPTPDISGHSGWSGTVPGGAWVKVSWSVPADYRVGAFAFRWLFGADEATVNRGWLIDDVSVTAQ